MTIAATYFKRIARATLVAAILGASALAAAPAQAQAFDFSITTPEGFSFSFGGGGFSGRQFHKPQRDYRHACMSDHELRRQLRDQGFYNIHLDQGRRGWVHIWAERRHSAYTMDVNTCTGTIANIDRERGHRRRGSTAFGDN